MTDQNTHDRGNRNRRKTDDAGSQGALGRWVPEDSPRTRRLLRLGPTEGDPSEKLARRFFRPDPLVLYRGGSWRLATDGSLRRWDVSAQRWESIRPDEWSRDEATVVEEAAGEGSAHSDEVVDEDEVWSSIEGCTFLGGTLRELCVYGKYTIVFGREAVTMLSRQGGVVEIPCGDLVDVEIGGRGRITGGSLGGERFAFERAGGEVAATTVVRSIVARAGMDTSIRIETKGGDAYFHCDCATPDEIREPLETFIAGLRGEPERPHAELSGRLTQLADLRTRGLLTEEEFALAVGTVLGDEGQAAPAG